jgi:RecB family exonuclease
MNTLHIYPTSRALRYIRTSYRHEEGFLPALMRMDEFEQRIMLLPGKEKIDPFKRMLLLREAASFKGFEQLHFEREMIRFFSKSEAVFKFYEELAAEKVDFATLAEADAYAEFGTHLEILETLQARYCALLEAEGLTDRLLYPMQYRLNRAFLLRYEKVVIHLEGYLSRFELALLIESSAVVPIEIHYHTTQFNRKMQERFGEYGIALPNHSYVVFDLQSREVLHTQPLKEHLSIPVYAVEEREEQIALAFMRIEEMVRSGIDPEEIVLILPDESFKEHVALFDRWNNLNFAMGYDYSHTGHYRRLDALYRYWQQPEAVQRQLLVHYGMEAEALDAAHGREKEDIKGFFAYLDVHGLSEEKEERVNELQWHFETLFKQETFSQKEWLFLWLKALDTVTIDDVRGGKVTVMGVLESRGVSFKGVVIVDFNEGIVPASSSKDQFLNSQVRAFAGLPTRSDREALQKQYYRRLLEQAQQAAIIYATADNRLPSKFIYELGLGEAEHVAVPRTLLYAQPSQLVKEKDPVVPFDAHSTVWSASRLKTYLTCKRKYYYRYITNIPAKEEKELIEGHFLHRVLEQLFRANDSYTDEAEMHKELAKLIDTMHPADDARAMYQKMLWKERLQPFVKQQVAHFKAGWCVVSREEEYETDIGGLRFKGRIDRIDQNDTHTLVVDYKSGSTAEANKKQKLENLTDFQMSIYDRLLEGRFQNVSLVFWKLFEEGMREDITVLEEKNTLLDTHIVELKQTRELVAKKCETLSHCTYCEYALLCERGAYL